MPSCYLECKDALKGPDAETAEENMNVLMVVGEVAQGGGAESWIWRDSCALCLFVAGGVALGVAAYLLQKTPTLLPVRYLRRR